MSGRSSAISTKSKSKIFLTIVVGTDRVSGVAVDVAARGDGAKGPVMVELIIGGGGASSPSNVKVGMAESADGGGITPRPAVR